MNNGYKTFEDMKVWQLAREFRKKIYIITKKFPKEELYGLTSQMRRAAVSITSNIAEGWGRFSYQENIQFCRTSRGSTNEILDQLYVALDENFITEEEFTILYEDGRVVERSINGYIIYLQQQKDLL